MNIKDILKEDLAQAVIKEFGLEGESDEAKAYLIAKLGENIMGRIVLSVHTVLPPKRRPEFEQLLEAGDPAALEKFIYPYIPNFDLFVQQEAQKEIARTKEYMQKAAAKTSGVTQ